MFDLRMTNVSAVAKKTRRRPKRWRPIPSKINQAVGTSPSISEENSAAGEEVSASTEEMTAQVEEVSASAQTLSEMANKLTDLVLRFKI
jgi:methyl-accepting chemotaxis protein